jgi:hypothetical protein
MAHQRIVSARVREVSHASVLESFIGTGVSFRSIQLCSKFFAFLPLLISVALVDDRIGRLVLMDS